MKEARLESRGRSYSRVGYPGRLPGLMEVKKRQLIGVSGGVVG